MWISLILALSGSVVTSFLGMLCFKTGDMEILMIPLHVLKSVMKRIGYEDTRCIGNESMFG